MPPTEPPARVLTRRRAVGDAIRDARKAAGLTQEVVALLIGMERHNDNRIERAHVSARLDSPLLIADAIGVPPADLVRQAGGTQEVGAVNRRGAGSYSLPPPQHPQGAVTGPFGVAITTKPRPGHPRVCRGRRPLGTCA